MLKKIVMCLIFTPPIKNYLIFLAFLLFINTSFSQQTKIDSLENVLEKTEIPTERLTLLELLSDISMKHMMLKDVLPYFEEMLTLSIELKKPKEEAKAYRCLAEYYLKEMDSVQSKKYALRCIDLTNKTGDNYGYLLSIISLGRIYHKFQNFEKAIDTYLKGINRFKNTKEKNLYGQLSTLHMNLYNSYNSLGKDEESLKALLNGLKFTEGNNDVDLNCYVLYVIGYEYMERDNFKKSEEYFLRSLSYSGKGLSKNVENMNHHGLGLNYSRWGKYEKALKYSKKALFFFKQTNNKAYVFDTLNNIAILYDRMGKHKECVDYGKKALEAARKIGAKSAINAAKHTVSIGYLNLHNYKKAEKYLLEIAKDTINPKLIKENSKLEIYLNFARIYENLNKPKKSISFYKKHLKLKDSLYEKEKKSKFADIETKYQTEKKEKENLQLKVERAEQQQQLTKENKQKWLYGIGFLTSVLALTIFVYYYRRNQQQKALIESLQKELHHRVKNNLSIIDRFVEVLKEKFNQPEFTLKLTELQNRIASINEVHQQLYSSKNVTQLNIKAYINKLVNNVQQSFPNHSITIHQQIDENLELTSTKSFPLGIIINEFLTNSYKYAFTNAKGNININIDENQQYYSIVLSDNGKGLPKDFDIKTNAHFGLRIIRLLCMQINANFTLKNENGVQLCIKVPKRS